MSDDDAEERRRRNAELLRAVAARTPFDSRQRFRLNAAADRASIGVPLTVRARIAAAMALFRALKP